MRDIMNPNPNVKDTFWVVFVPPAGETIHPEQPINT